MNFDHQLENINILQSQTKYIYFKVKQYDLKGNYIKTFEDVSAAAKEVQINNQCISTACKNVLGVSAGFRWEYDVDAPTQTKKLTNDGLKKKVNQYNLDGSYIKTFNCISDAAWKVNLKIAQISNVCNKKSDDAGEFIWRFTDDLINPTNDLTVDQIKRPSHKTKQVDQFTLNGIFIRRFESLDQATKELTNEEVIFLSSGISRACTGTRKTYKNFIWRHVNS